MSRDPIFIVVVLVQLLLIYGYFCWVIGRSGKSPIIKEKTTVIWAGERVITKKDCNLFNETTRKFALPLNGLQRGHKEIR